MSKRHSRGKQMRDENKKFQAERRRELAKRAAEFGVRVPDVRPDQQPQPQKEKDSA